jgi:hypothetical protein
MSQHWEDRTEEDRRAFVRVTRGVDPRRARRSEGAGNWLIAVLLAAWFWAVAGAPRLW